MKILIVGDVHGDFNYIRETVDRAGDIDAVYQLGDFGYGFASESSLVVLNTHLGLKGLKLYFTPGNHEDWDSLDRLARINDRDDNGFITIFDNVLFAPRIHTWEWDGKRFVSYAGAFSIDRDWRLTHFITTGVRSYWPREIVGDDEINAFDFPLADILFTHDCSNKTVMNNVILIPESEANRVRVDRVIGMTRPHMHFHGHMHEQYDWTNYSHYPGTLTYGMNCNGRPGTIGILDTDTMTFERKN